MGSNNNINGTNLLISNTQATLSDIDSNILYVRWPIESTIFAILAWVGVIIFGIALLIFLKDTSRVTTIYCFKSRIINKERKRLEKQQSKEKFHSKMNGTKIVPISESEVVSDNVQNDDKNNDVYNKPKRRFGQSKEKFHSKMNGTK